MNPGRDAVAGAGGERVLTPPAAGRARAAAGEDAPAGSPAWVAADTRVRPRDLRGLLWTLVRTDVKVYYHGSLAGFLWALLRPLSMFLALAVVFAMVFSAQPNFVLNLLIGLFLYEFFSEGTKAGLTSLYARGYLLTKTRFQYWIVVPISSVNALIVLLVFMTALLGYLAVSGLLPGAAQLALFVWYVFLLWVMIMGIALGTSALYLRFRDLNHIWDAIIQAGFFVAPIIVTLDMIPAAVHRWLFLWPPTPVIVYSRRVLIDGVIPGAIENLYLVGMATVILVAGAFVFRRLARNAAEKL